MPISTQILGKMLAGSDAPAPLKTIPAPITPMADPMAPIVDPVALSPDIQDDMVGDIDTSKEKATGLPMDPLTLSDFLLKYETDHDNRQYTDWSWFVYDSYVKGDHFVKFNDITKMVEATPSTSGQRFAINKVWTTLRSVRGFITKYDPKWYVYPEDASDDSIQKAKYKQRVLDDQWIFEEMKSKTKDVIFHGLKYSVGILELVWDKEDQVVDYIPLDPFDVYFGGPAMPYTTRITKAIWRTHEDIKNDPKYKSQIGDLSTTDQRFASNLKQQMQDATYGHQNTTQSDEGTMVYEMHYTVGKENSKGGKVNIATFTDTTFLRHVETDIESLWDVFQLYSTDRNPGENYGEGWVKNLIPPQKMLDILEGLTMQYHHTFAKGRYVVAENSGAKVITNDNGTIIQHAAGKRPVIENAPSMAASVDNQISRINIYLEDIGGQHDASMGRLPTGASAGVAIEALQEGDANNLKDLVENYNIFLTQVAYATFKMYAKRLKTTKVIQTDDKDADGKPDFFAIIGEDAGNIPETINFRGKTIPVCVIHDDEKVRVSVDSWLAYTRDAREQRVYKHYTAGLIDRKTALTALQYGDIDNVISNAIKEQVVAQMVAAGVPEQAPPTETPSPETDTAGAISPDAGIPMPNA